MPVVPQPACKAVLSQATTKWPKRNKASDGLLPSAAHVAMDQKAGIKSDHDTGYAADLTHDPVNGPDAQKLFVSLRTDKRVKYLIHNGKIWSQEKGERPYVGPSPHIHHIHISVKDGMGNDTSPWFN